MKYSPQNRGRPGAHSGGAPAPAPKAIDVRFYLDQERKTINPTLLDTDAESQAAQLHEKINSAQIRRFFGEIKNLYLRMEQGRAWTDVEPFLRMVKSKAMYALGTGRIEPAFCSFMTTNIDKIQDQKDFEAFVKYFEAVLGYAYGKGLVKK